VKNRKQYPSLPETPEPAGDPVQRNIETVVRLEQTAQAPRSLSERFTDRLTQFIGSLTFVYLHVLWFTVWTLLNLAPWRWHPFDPFPFPLLGLLLTMEAIFLATFILIGQNRQQRLADRRNHLDLQINLLAEQEVTQILKMLEALQERLGIGDHDPHVQALKQAVEPEKLMEQIEVQVEHLEQNPNPAPGTPDAGPGASPP
jgi:uncharacterized membrane protein